MSLRVIGACYSFDGDLLVKVVLRVIIFCERCVIEKIYGYNYL